VQLEFPFIRPHLGRRLLTGLALAGAGLGVAAAPGLAESAYERAVVHETGARVYYYLRLGEVRDYPWGPEAQNVVGPNDGWGPPGGTYGSQVVRGRPGALAGDPDRAAEFLGGVADGVWGSHVRSWEQGPHSLERMPFSVEAWVKPRVLHDSARRIFSSEDRTGGYLLAARRSGLVFGRYTRAGTHPFGHWPERARRTVPTRWSTVTAPVSPGVWTHVVGVYDSDAVRLYVNGAEVDSRPSTFDLAASWPEMGIASTRAGWLEWDGLLDELAVYAGALTPQEVARHYRIGTDGAA
jgi:hypothetical protein